jgi:hypothetical protein
VIVKDLFPGLEGDPLKIPAEDKTNPAGGVVELPHVVDPLPPATEN